MKRRGVQRCSPPGLRTYVRMESKPTGNDSMTALRQQVLKARHCAGTCPAT